MCPILAVPSPLQLIALCLCALFPGLQHNRYLNVYKKYDDLLDNTAEQGITEFLNKNHEIEDFVTVGDATKSFMP